MKYYVNKSAKWLIIFLLTFLILRVMMGVRQFLLQEDNSFMNRLIFYDDTTTTKPWDWDDENLKSPLKNREELVSASDLKVPTQNYSFHPSCQCVRQGPSLEHLQTRFETHKQFWDEKLKEIPLKVPKGVYIGSSSCSDYTSALGAGQKVLSYTYYSPWRTVRKQYFENGKPTDTEERFLELLQPMTKKVAELYPGWRVRIYHNVTMNETEAWDTLCSLYCQYDFIDLCDTRALPTVGDLNTKFPIGRFWRFQVLADPTVSVFGSRDVDSFLTEREAASVGAWLVSGKQWHVMRDGPFHRSTILAGLWGGANYENLTMASLVRSQLLGVQPNLYKFYDQRILHGRVWPVIREHAAIYDSYNCGMIWKFGHCRPWPTQRKGFFYVGYGPTKNYAMRALRRKRCPVKCRPEAHKDWQFC